MLQSRLLLYLLCFVTTCLAKELQDSNTIKPVSNFLTTQHKTQRIYSLYKILAKQKDIASSAQWHALLHYEGNKSLINKTSNFFISKDGYKNPLAEYNAFIYTILLQELNAIHHSKKQSYDDASLLCKYPARLTLIATSLYGLERKQFLEYIYSKNCVGLRMFRESVDFSSIALEFAGESNGMLHSAMGHIYLTANNTNAKYQDDVKNFNKAYTISFFAIPDSNFNPLKLISIIFTGGVDGAVVLMPARIVRQEYLDDEKRTLYSFKPLLNEHEKQLLRQHLWELKNKEIHYNIITYNCNTAIRKILGAANPLFDTHSKKPFQTPTEYLSLLHKKGLITKQNVILPPKRKAFVEKYGQNNVLNTKKNSRISFAYSGFLQPNKPQSKSQIQLEFSPIYIDGRNADSAYEEFMESKAMALSLGFDFTALKPYIQKLELLRLKSVLDLPKAHSFSKFFNISFEGNLYQPNHKGGFLALPNTSSHIMPTIEVGIGVGKYTKYTRWYILPRIGYRYDIMNNVYLGVESGMIASFSLYNHDFKGIFNYTYFYDFMTNNRGYDGMLYAYFGMAISKNVDMFIESKYYHTLLKPKIQYEARQFIQYNIGMAFNF